MIPLVILRNWVRQPPSQQRLIVLQNTRTVWNATYENIREEKEIREAIEICRTTTLHATNTNTPNSIATDADVDATNNTTTTTMEEETKKRMERLRMEYKHITGEDYEEDCSSNPH
jgi:hypothetical protein